MKWLATLLVLFGMLEAQGFEDYIKYSLTEENRVGYIYVGGHQTAITQGTLLYVQKALERFKENPPCFVILELDTPGGEVFSAQKISDLLKELDTQQGIPVVAYINNWAISAGALLAYSCRYITVVKDGVMGAAEPVTAGGEKTSEKVNSAIRADIGARASFFNRNPLIAKAMVDQDMVLVWRNGEVLELKDNNEIKESDDVIIRSGKLLTLSSSEMEKYGVTDLIVEPKKARGNLPNLFTAPFFKEIPSVRLEKVELDWKDQFILFLSQPAISGFLMMGMMISFYIEMSTPGFGVFGTLGIICLFLLILPSVAMQLAGWFELLLVFLGIVLLAVELLVIPGFGFIGFSGIALLLSGLILLLVPALREAQFSFDTGDFNAAALEALDRLSWFSIYFVISVIVLAVLARYLVPRIHFFSPLILRNEQQQGSGFEESYPIEKFLGKEGVALTPLAPFGKVKIGHDTVDAHCSSGFLEKGCKVRVVSINGNVVETERIE